MDYKTTINKNFNGDFELMIIHNIKNGYEEQYPIVEDDIKWETERQGTPGKLTFKVYKDNSGNLNFQEGDVVQLTFYPNGKENKGDIVFYGYVFTKKRNKNGWIDVTAYDQLRYLKNKATYKITNQTASEIVKMIAEDYQLKLGVIENTNYVIGSRLEDDQSLFDIIQNALDLTLINTGKKYILYDYAGQLYLRNVDNLKTDIIINESVAEDFDYSSSIDEETYNEIELHYDNNETNKREYKRVYNTASINAWGRLRLTESVQNPTNMQDRVKQMLKLYNRKTRELKVKKAFGDIACRAGASVICQLLLGDVEVDSYMLIESATHTFNKNNYRMDLTLGIHSDSTYNSTDEIYDEYDVALKTTPNSNKDNLSNTSPSKSTSSKDSLEQEYANDGLYKHGLDLSDNNVITVQVKIPNTKNGFVEVRVDKNTYFITQTTTFYVKKGWFVGVAPQGNSGYSYQITEKVGIWDKYEYKDKNKDKNTPTRYYYSLWSTKLLNTDFSFSNLEDYNNLSDFDKKHPRIAIKWVR